MAQGLRLSFYEFPVFWRVDLDITFDQDCQQKWPSPFPDWSVATSAFWNVVWAVKYSKRGNSSAADHYLATACDKLQRNRITYSVETVLALLADLSDIEETGSTFIAKLMEELGETDKANDGVP